MDLEAVWAAVRSAAEPEFVAAWVSLLLAALVFWLDIAHCRRTRQKRRAGGLDLTQALERHGRAR